MVTTPTLSGPTVQGDQHSLRGAADAPSHEVVADWHSAMTSAHGLDVASTKCPTEPATPQVLQAIQKDLHTIHTNWSNVGSRRLQDVMSGHYSVDGLSAKDMRNMDAMRQPASDIQQMASHYKLPEGIAIDVHNLLTDADGMAGQLGMQQTGQSILHAFSTDSPVHHLVDDRTAIEGALHAVDDCRPPSKWR